MSNIKFEYTPTSWATSTRITPERLNKMENAFVQLSTVVSAITVELSELKETLNSLTRNLNTWQNNVKLEIEEAATQIVTRASDNINKTASDTIAALGNNAQSTLDDMRINVESHIEGYVGPIVTSMNDQITAMEGANRNTEAKIELLRTWKDSKDTADTARDTELSEFRTWRTTKDADDTRRDSEVATIRSNAITSTLARDMLRTIASEEGYTTAANFNDRARAAGLATQTDVSTAVSAEAVNRATAISSATSGLVRNDDFTTKANAFISGLGFVKEDDLNTKIDSRTSVLGLIRGSDVDSKITVATSTLATKAELTTERTAREAAIATEATNRTAAITAEATARTNDITNATSGLITLNDITSDKITQLGFAKSTDVANQISSATNGLADTSSLNSLIETALSTKNFVTQTDLNSVQDNLTNVMDNKITTFNANTLTPMLGDYAKTTDVNSRIEAMNTVVDTKIQHIPSTDKVVSGILGTKGTFKVGVQGANGTVTEEEKSLEDMIKDLNTAVSNITSSLQTISTSIKTLTTSYNNLADSYNNHLSEEHGQTTTGSYGVAEEDVLDDADIFAGTGLVGSIIPNWGAIVTPRTTTNDGEE